MEVHHHTHTERKKFTHYLWEFLMLFLAVFCGFLAENQREHLIEHQRERQYLRSMLKDLQSDTETMKRVYKLALIQKLMMDSLIALGNEAPLKGEDIRKFYLLKGKTTRFLNIHLEDGTSSQLKNAGGMRLIRNEQINALIRKYWDHVEILYRVRDRLEMAGETIADVSSKIFNYKYLVPGIEPLDPPVAIRPGAEFINDDPKLTAEYINRVSTKLLRTGVYISELEGGIEAADRLMESIKKEYHLD
jgi:hypothetical protein